MRLAVDQNRATLKSYVEKVLSNEKTPADLKEALEGAMAHFENSKTEEAVKAQDKAKEVLAKYADVECPDLAKVRELQDYFTDKSVWIIGGDGWANDIGYGGIDHVLAQDKVYVYLLFLIPKFTQIPAVRLLNQLRQVLLQNLLQR